ncbi:nucleotidyltransferase family protein [Methanothermococcus sp. SCGC AD-155-C09]|nr:nucleotidyltransferase family protein [Methanothermococcus sp. SCGC AD-155-C09]
MEINKNNFNEIEIELILREWEVVKYLKILKKLKPILKKEFKVSRIGIFGSVVRGEQRKDSDIDIIVEFSEPIGLRFIELAEFLEKKLGRKVDLVSKEGISPYIKPYIEREVTYV